MTTRRYAVMAAVALISVQFLSHAQTGQVGVWQNVTPSDCPLQSAAGAWSGVMFVAVDPAKPSDAYFHCDSRGVWKTTDYGATWKKTSTGTNGDKLATGRAWGGAIDPNPSRDPSTPPTLYVTEGYGAVGLWKSTDGGVNWSDVWNNNVYAADGTTNVYGDAGRDCMWIVIPDQSDVNNVFTCLHSYYGTQGWSGGLFQSQNGGGKWAFQHLPFTFSAHGDVVGAIDKNTWFISDGHPSVLQRTTDAGITWNQVSTLGVTPLRFCKVGNAIYMMGAGVYKSTNNGAAWVQLNGTSSTSTIVATATTLYTTNANNGASSAQFRHAKLTNDNVWVDDPSPAAMRGGFDMDVTFDGSHYILLGGMWETGIWRYVEPTGKPNIVLTDSAISVDIEMGNSSAIKTVTLKAINRIAFPHLAGPVTISKHSSWLTVSVNAANPDSQVITNTINPSSFPQTVQKYYDTVTVHATGAEIEDLKYIVMVWVRDAAGLSSFAIQPAGSGSIPSSKPFQFSATAYDQYDLPLSPQPNITWTATGGIISSTGLFTPSASSVNAVIAVSTQSGTAAVDTVKASITPCSNGLSYDYYSHIWVTGLSGVPTGAATQTGTAANVSINPTTTSADSFALRFKGYVMISASGSYTFFTTSDDGSALYIDNNKIVDNDGVHAGQERSGTVNLGWGLHAIEVLYFEQNGGQDLSMKWQGPGIAKAAIPDSMLFHGTGATVMIRNEKTGTGNESAIKSGLMQVTRGGIAIAISLSQSWTLDLFAINGSKVAQYQGTGSSSVSFDKSKWARGFILAKLRSGEMESVMNIIAK